MKKTLLFFILNFIFTSFLICQSIYFNKRIDISGDWEVCRGIVPFKNGYFVAGGYLDARIYMSYIDSIGNLKWTQQYNQVNYSYYFGLSGSLFHTKDKKSAICGSRVPIGPRGYSLLIKVDSLGNKIWEKEYQLSDHSNSLSSGNITNDSGFVLTGRIIDPGPRNKYLLIKTDSIGSIQWYKMYTDNDPNRNYEGICVMQTTDSGFCLGGNGGYHPSSNYYYIAEIIKTDSLGNEKWKKTFGNPLYCNWGTMLSLSKDSCIVATYSLAFSSEYLGNRQIYIAKFSLDGIEKWNKKIGLPSPGNWSSWIQTLSNGSYIISGNHLVKDTISKCVGFLFKLNNNGDSLWYREYAVIQGPLDINELWQVTSTPDKGFAATGFIFPRSAGGSQDIWIFKTDSMGCLVPNCHVGITEFNPNAGAQMVVYPNPFSNAFAINYNIPKENKEAVFELRDIMGKLVYSTPLTINVNQLQVVASALKPGLYFASLVVDGVLVSTDKIIKE
jgi:hypothetical protein